MTGQSVWGFAAAFVFSSLAHTVLGSPLSCGQNQYPRYSKCCNKCPPGWEMKERCKPKADTRCEPCPKQRYSENFGSSDCKPCTVCFAERGLEKVKKCSSTSNTICTCRAGYSPAKESDDIEQCIACREGYFSRGQKEMCQPWTNCAAQGRKTLRSGTSTSDAICDNPPSPSPRSTISTLPHSSPGNGVGTSAVTTLKPTSPPVTPPTDSSLDLPSVTNWGFLIVPITCATLLLGIAGAVCYFLQRLQRKKVAPERLEVPFHEDGRKTYRIPIQEQQVDLKSSLVRN
ncbi:tumor necrosis factor receptor superfamily member 4 [Hemicordylus capensis]|uniref:tumor necrosis factor receptor superfamily member 4 n=1 Tax=Hemicordylus capensis TaxID=884348 RepID=UPI0023025520|nr:tumor necrosis factor receptor superfamily member 4 [Hemicordylus capensis]